MKKGIYTAAVSIIVIALITASAFDMVSTAQSHEQKNLAKSLVKMKWEMQNSEEILNKSIADALSDDGFNQGCSYNQTTIKTTLENYLGNTLSGSFGNCNIGEIDVQGDRANTAIAFDLECTEDTDKMKTHYKKAMSYSKEITYRPNPNCLVDIKDLETGECEVDKIPGASQGCWN